MGYCRVLLLVGLTFLLVGCVGEGNTRPQLSINSNNMKVFSNDFKDNQKIPSRFTCDGEDVRPQLAWSEVPQVARSLALVVFDPDAPGKGWLHYLVVNLPPVNMVLNGGDAVPAPGVELTNDFGQTAYGGPCPPSGRHRYIITLYAFDVEKIEPVNYAEFLQLAQEHVVAEAMLTGLYQRQ